MDALAFLPATEVAARVRDGSVSAREVVEAAVRRIEALDPQLNAFVELDAKRALAEADTIARGRPARVRRRPDRDQGQHAGGGDVR